MKKNLKDKKSLNIAMKTTLLAIYFSAYVDCQRETFKREGQTTLLYKYPLV